jgi:CobQ-like glutamine amidotransferase family enzyme
MSSELDSRLAVYRAEKKLNDWIAHHGPILSREVASPDSQGMLINLLSIADGMKIQLHALAEQLTQEIWEERLRSDE